MKEKYITPCELSNYKKSANFTETVSFYRQLEEDSPYLNLTRIGYTGSGNNILLVEISDNKPEAKFTLLIQNNIHPGEPEGNDATMMLVREILSSENCEALLQGFRILILPIFNPDGHRASGMYNRVNQKGPLLQGWRTNDLNQNLNRDYLKADSQEIKKFLKIVNKFKPDLFVDNHTTNGLDYQYHITYSLEKEPILSKELSDYAHNIFLPFLQERLTQTGFLHTHYIELAGKELDEGITRIAGMPRFSTGYMALRSRIGLLVETHSLKPFENRVKSTLEINRSVVEFAILHKKELKLKNITSAKNEIISFHKNQKKFAVNWQPSEEATEEKFAAFSFDTEYSEITGSEVKRYTSHPEEVVIPVYKDVNILQEIKLPNYYLVPVTYIKVNLTLAAHGFFAEQNFIVNQNLTRFKITSVRFAAHPYEGRFRIVDFTYETEKVDHYPYEHFNVYSTQGYNPRILGFLLDPRSPESLFQWGFFNNVFERKEYAEDFVFEPIAAAMYRENPKLRNEFNKLLKDESFSNNPDERLDFFYRRSPYFDKRENIYPVYFM